LKGLEVSILATDQVFFENRDKRLDSQYFRRAALAADQLIAQHSPERIAEIASEVRSFGAYALTNEFEYQEDGIPFIRGTDYSGDFINFSGVLRISEEAHTLLYKSEVQPGMVLLSMSGSVGSVAVALESWHYPINSNQDIAKIMPVGVSPFFMAAYLACRYGQVQIDRLPVGSVQQHVFLWMIERIQIPRFSSALEGKIAALSRRAYSQHEAVNNDFQRADDALLAALGLANWTPPEPLAYSARASDVFASGRFDARFFAPRIQALLDLLAVDGRTIADVADPRREKFHPSACAAFDYIEISDIDGAGAATSTRLASGDAPSRATWHVRAGDIITSTVRPIRRLSAQITPKQEGFVCSSGFVVVTPRDIAPEVLLTYLRLPVICELLDLFASASMYPAITDADIFNLPLPHIPDAVADQVTQNVIAAKAAKARAANLLEAAKRAVEIAIEDGEPAAMAYLDQAEGAI
jgi:type I restriction enzyme S subunit